MTRLIALRETPLSVDECLAAVRRADAGGIAVFAGTVRDHDHGRPVVALDYSAHPSAEDVLRQVADEVAAAYPVLALAAVHRLGELAIGDTAVVVAVSCAHRDAAFGAARLLIDELKARVPIWKRQVFADGTTEWVGCA